MSRPTSPPAQAEAATTAASKEAGAGHWRAGLITGGLGLLLVMLLPLPGAAAQPQPLTPVDVTASATAGPSRDDAGTPVTYEASHVTDGKAKTAWRVPGNGVGRTLTFRFRGKVHLSRIGLILGYAKLDPLTGVSRFWENRRVLSVTYALDGRAPVGVRFRDSAEMQWFGVNADATTVVIRLTSSTKKSKRDFTAISEVRFAGWPIAAPPRTTPPPTPGPSPHPQWMGWLRRYGLPAGIGVAAGVVVFLAAAVASRRGRRPEPTRPRAQPARLQPEPAPPQPEPGAGAPPLQDAPTGPFAPVSGGGQPGGPPDHRLRASPWLKERIADNLGVLLTALGGFVAASLVAPLQQLRLEWRLTAAVLAFGAVLATLSLLRSQTSSIRTRQVAASLAVCAALALIPGWIFRPHFSNLNQPADLVLLDASQAMSEHFEASTKLAAARNSVIKQAKKLKQQLGLATYGVKDCASDSPYELRMSINRDGRAKLPDALSGVRLQGRSDLALAAIRALEQLEPFKEEPKRLLIFTGALDGCGGSLRDVIAAAQNDHVNVEWDIVGLGHDPGVPSGNGVNVFNVQTQAQLDGVVQDLLVLDPATHEIDTLEKALGTVRDNLNAAIPALKARDVKQMDALHSKLTQEVARGKVRFDRDLWTETPKCGTVANFERTQFGRLTDGIRHLGDILKFDRDHPKDLSDDLQRERDGLLHDWDNTVRDYNADVNDLSELVDACLDALA
jgi:hypothetical protein